MTKKEKTQLDIVIAKLDILLDRTKLVAHYNVEKTGINYTEFSEHGGIRIKEVDQLITNKLLSGDPLWRQVAEQTNEYYCFLAPYSNFSEDVTNQIQANQERVWVSSEMVGNNISDMVNMLPMYIHKNGDVSWSQPTFLMFGGWTRIKKRQINKVPNHSVVAYGNYSNPKHLKWQSRLRDMIPRWVEQKMQRDYDLLKGTT